MYLLSKEVDFTWDVSSKLRSPTPHPGVWFFQGHMFHCTAVDVSQLRDEVQSGRLGESLVYVWERKSNAGSFSHIESIPGPVDFNRSRIEPSNVTDHSVLLAWFHTVGWVDHTVGRIWGQNTERTSEPGVTTTIIITTTSSICAWLWVWRILGHQYRNSVSQLL